MVPCSLQAERCPFGASKPKRPKFPCIPAYAENHQAESQTVSDNISAAISGLSFVQVDQLAGNWRKINNTRGVARLVQLGAEPCPLPDTVIDALIERCDAEQVLQDSGVVASRERGSDL